MRVCWHISWLQSLFVPGLISNWHATKELQYVIVYESGLWIRNLKNIEFSWQFQTGAGLSLNTKSKLFFFFYTIGYAFSRELDPDPEPSPFNPDINTTDQGSCRSTSKYFLSTWIWIPSTIRLWSVKIKSTIQIEKRSKAMLNPINWF